jgi:hypothetical protein
MEQMSDASACCSATAQATCCEPSDKASCCGAETASTGAAPSSCGCAAGQDAPSSEGAGEAVDDPDELPVAVIGAGPVGLAAAAHLIARGIEPLVFEVGKFSGVLGRRSALVAPAVRAAQRSAGSA